MKYTDRYLPDVLKFLSQYCGLRYWMEDVEGKEIGIEISNGLTKEELEAIVCTWGDALKTRMYSEQQRRLSVCVGGPRNGQPHGKHWEQTLLFHEGRAKWAAYWVKRDRRAWFAGYATSKAKARRLAFTLHVEQKGNETSDL